eukprot:GHVQ01004484.1.p1 GENE.GHVQ01004484.1~~GHVQ01004484.1.p1  ORF type:complete len:117 (+),score=5.51 GHVQ01004484.1:221-571(+)
MNTALSIAAKLMCVPLTGGYHKPMERILVTAIFIGAWVILKRCDEQWDLDESIQAVIFFGSLAYMVLASGWMAFLGKRTFPSALFDPRKWICFVKNNIFLWILNLFLGYYWHISNL